MFRNMTKMANSLVGYIAHLRQLAFLCKGWLGVNTEHKFASNLFIPQFGMFLFTNYLQQA